MSKKTGTKSANVYHRKDFMGVKNNRRVVCDLCGVKHYELRYHYCVFKPDLLDLYCCAGGAAHGYYQAGFNVTGVDIVHRKNYFADFIQADAIEYVKQHGHKYKFIHASPPCQKYSKSTALHRSRGYEYPDLVDATRDALESAGVPYVIENVMQAPIRKDLELRGEMFGLKVIRQRKFEFGGIVFTEPAPEFNKISVLKGEAVSVYGAGGSFKRTGHGSGSQRHLIIPEWRLSTVRQTWAYAMGVSHYTTDLELSEMIPPAYSKFIGDYIRPMLST